MSIPRSTRAVVAVSTIAVLSACSGGSQLAPMSPQQSPQQAVGPRIPSLDALSVEGKTKKPTPLVFAADEGSRTQSGAVYAYLGPSGTSPLWKITSPLKYPDGLWVDASSNLYVGDASGFVYEFNTPTASGPPSAPNFTYNDPGGYQVGHIAVCGNYLYAADIITPDNSQGGFTVWKIGTATPVLQVSQAQYVVGEGVSCDSKTGKMYFAYNASYAGPGEVDEYAEGGTGNPTNLPTDPAYTQGLTFNKAYSTYVMGDPYNPKGSAIEFWKPTGKSAVHSIIQSWVSNPNGFAYELGDKALWDADLGNLALHRFSASKGTLLSTITSTGNGTTFLSLQDVATSPPDHK